MDVKNRLEFINSHVKRTFTDKTWMYLVLLISLIFNIFYSIKVLNIVLVIWFLLLAFDLLFKATEASDLMKSKPTANVAKLIYLLIGLSILLIFIVATNHFVFAIFTLVFHYLLYSFISIVVCRNIGIYLQKIAALF